MNGADLAFTPAREQAAMIRRGDVSPSELVETYLERIERIDPRLDAYLTVAADAARDAARAAEERLAAGDEAPFLGVPISVKDLLDTAGIRTTHGSAAWRERVPEHDAEAVRRLRAAGFVVLGKTNTPQFGCRATTESPEFPTCRNPWDTTRHAGGSSGGAASALAAGLCPISLGTDGGGSIRIPSGWCGVFGIKPSRGRVSSAPRPTPWASVIGPIARTVADAAALLDVVAGYVSGDPWWAPEPARPFVDEVGVDPDRPRVAVTTDHPNEHDEVHPAWRDATRAIADALADAGHDVVEAAPPTLDLLDAAAVTISEMLPEDAPADETCDPVYRLIAAQARSTSLVDYAHAMARLQRRVRDVVAFFDDHDVLLTPTLATPPPRIGEQILDEVDFESMLSLTSTVAFTPPWNQTGQPAVAVPAGLDDDELPVSVQLVGRPADEATLVRVAAWLEDARPWRDLRPPVD